MSTSDTNEEPTEAEVDSVALFHQLLEELPGMENERLVALGVSFLTSIQKHSSTVGLADLQVAALVGQLGQNELLRRFLVRFERRDE